MLAPRFWLAAVTEEEEQLVVDRSGAGGAVDASEFLLLRTVCQCTLLAKAAVRMQHFCDIQLVISSDVTK